MNSHVNDIIIIGAGPIGLACGIEAKKKGLSYLIVDRGALVNSIYNYPHGMSFFSSSEKLEIGNIPFISHQPKPNRSEALEYYRRVCIHYELNVRLYEEVIEITKLNSNGNFKVLTTKSGHEAKFIILATGFYDLPRKMNIPGESLSKVSHYYKEAHPYFGMDLAIVGAANSASDAALECNRKGARVTMIIREEKLGESIKYWTKPDLENRIQEGSIKALFNSNILEIKEHSIIVNQPTKQVELKNDFVLAMTGYEPDFNFLRKIGIEIQEANSCVPVHDDSTMETNIPGIYLAGVICGGLVTNKWFIENSIVHASKIVNHIKSANTRKIS